MPDRTRFVGIDLHQDSLTLAVLPAKAEASAEVVTLENDEGKVRRLFVRLLKGGPLGSGTLRGGHAAR